MENTQNTNPELPELEIQPAKKRFGFSLLGESGKFALTAGVIFAVLMAVLNFPAYAKIFDLTGSQAQASQLAASAAAIGQESRQLDSNELALPKLAAAEKKLPLPAADFDVAPPDDRLIIPSLGIHAPIQEMQTNGENLTWDTWEDGVQDALRHGVVHFPGSGQFGQAGNAFVTGHSSYYPWDHGRYKTVFAKLPQIQVGDEIVVWSGGQRHLYRVTETKEVKPSETDVLQSTVDARLTLMTCTPIGTALNRFIVTAQLENEPTGRVATNQ